LTGLFLFFKKDYITLARKVITGRVIGMDKNRKGPVLIAGAIIAWAALLWFFTINNPSFVPAARAIFIVLVVPLAAAEWLKMKGLIGEGKSLPVKIIFIAAALAAWYTWLK
jgi:hypothetical protein